MLFDKGLILKLVVQILPCSFLCSRRWLDAYLCDNLISTAKGEDVSANAYMISHLVAYIFVVLEQILSTELQNVSACRLLLLTVIEDVFNLDRCECDFYGYR